jgi:hypothetical protein
VYFAGVDTQIALAKRNDTAEALLNGAHLE